MFRRNRNRNRWTSLCRVAVSIAAVELVALSTAHAAAVDDIRMSRSGGVTTAEIELGCPMRYLDHRPETGGTELRIFLVLSEQCHLVLGGVRNELYRPESGHLADMEELEFDSLTVDRGAITLRFERPVDFQVSQGANLSMVRVRVSFDSQAEAQELPPITPPPVSSPEPPPRSGDREPIRLVETPNWLAGEMYAIRLTSLGAREEIDPVRIELFDSEIAYAIDVAIDGQKWKELRVGFYATEDEARAELTRLRQTFPDAWITVAGPDEQAVARQGQFAAEVIEKPASPPQAGLPRTLSDERVAELMADAKSALSGQEYDQAIRIYTHLLEQPGEHRREAREFLGVARERNGQLALAKAEYKEYLAEFPEGDDAKRVQQRLAALIVMSEPRNDDLRSVREQGAPEWDVYGTASQFYLRGVTRQEENDTEVVSQSALFSQADFLVTRRGKSIDLVGRANMGFLLDMMDEEANPENQALISFAYVDISADNLRLNSRVGRQTRHTDGVLGRFDGVYFSYGVWRNLSLNFTAGYPVDTPRHELNTRRSFRAASIDLNNVAGKWDFNAFVNMQEVDGISDREAIGAEVQYHDRRLNFVGLVDYDVSYNILNSAFLVGNWRVGNRLTLNGRYDFGAQPFITTSNALIGQPVRTVETLLGTYREPQIRRLARNRTDQVQHSAFGLSAVLSQRLQLDVDIGFSENEGTVSSGGVTAVPRLGPQYYYRLNFVGSSVFKSLDTVIFGLRHNRTRTYEENGVLLDMRLPFGDGLRLMPRLPVSLRRSLEDDAERWIASPMLRILYRWRRRYRVEIDLVGQWVNRDLPPNLIGAPTEGTTEETSAYYVRAGYWIDF